MKIVHVCTNDSGGAATAALRLHYGLLELGIDSSFLCLHKSKELNNVYKVPVNYPNTVQRSLDKIGFLGTIEQKNNRHLKKGGKYEIFSFPISSYNIESHPLIVEADIINLHWVANFIDYPSFFKNIKKTIIWTLHDMNPFLGGFHYQQDVERNTLLYGELETKLRNIKKRALSDVKKLIIVSPSKWLKRQSEQSELLGKFEHLHIPYGLDLQVYKQFPKEIARSVFNLPLNKNMLLFVSDNINNHRKGLDLLLGAIKNESIQNNILICAVGYYDKNFNYGDIIQLGKITDERLLPLLYSAADVLVIPSREDNLPNVMLESIACGTPVIAFPIGGRLDVIEDWKTGLLAEDVSIKALQDAILKYFDQTDTFDRDLIRRIAIENFALPVQALKYLELYKSTLA